MTKMIKVEKADYDEFIRIKNSKGYKVSGMFAELIDSYLKQENER